MLTAGGTSAMAAAETSPWYYHAWQTGDGLPDNSITGVAQTRDGYLWVATTGGLVRFNGTEFTSVPRASFPIMPSQTARIMIRDQQDRLWLAMERGPVLCLQPDGLRVFGALEGVPNERVLSMATDGNGAVWVAYLNTLLRIQGGVASLFPLPPGVPPSEGSSCLAANAHGTLWFSRRGWLGILGPDGFRPVRKLNGVITSLGAAQSGLWLTINNQLIKLEDEAGKNMKHYGYLPSNARPVALLEDRSGTLWIGTAANGLFRLEGSHFEPVPTSHPEITCLTEDREGNLCVGTAGGGLNLIRLRAVTLLDRASGLPFDSAKSVCEDTEGCRWAVSQKGELARERQGQWELMSAAANWPGGNATCVAADQRDGVWVGTVNQGLKQFQNGQWREWRMADGLASDAVRSLLVASNGDVWAASDSPPRLQWLHQGMVQRVLTPTNENNLGVIRAMVESADGSIWIGTSEGEIQRVNGPALVNDPAIEEPLRLSVRSLLATSDGSLWIGYAGDGLGRLKDGKYVRVTAATSGLADDFISQLLTDANGNLWIAGNRGLSRVPLLELAAVMDGRAERVRPRVYGRNDGLPGLEPNRDNCPPACHGRDGRLWFSMHSGLLMVRPDNIQYDAQPPPVCLERVSLDDLPVAVYDARSPLQLPTRAPLLDLHHPDNALRIAPGHHKIEFDFAALSFASPENVRIRYQLTGFDRQWIEAGTRHAAIYPQLPAGNYEFQVLACQNGGAWSPAGKALPLIVSPFFWETWWFKLSGGLAAMAAAGGAALFLSRRRYRRKLQRLEARRALEQERARIAKDIHDDLGSSLTRITLLSQPTRSGAGADGESAASLEQIHATARQLTRSMEEVVWAVNPEHDTFDGLANYLSNYAQSFLRPAGVRCRLEMPMQLPALPLSAEVRHNLFLAFKEALNNVVKHAQATEVRISLTPGRTGLELLVEDNGRGLPPRTAAGNGLANMRSRMDEIGGYCEVQSTASTGASVKFSVPLKPPQGPP